MRGDGFPARAARGLSLLLYSPGSHEEHIRCSSARAELATNITKTHRATYSTKSLSAQAPVYRASKIFKFWQPDNRFL